MLAVYEKVLEGSKRRVKVTLEYPEKIIKLSLVGVKVSKNYCYLRFILKFFKQTL